MSIGDFNSTIREAQKLTGMIERKHEHIKNYQKQMGALDFKANQVKVAFVSDNLRISMSDTLCRANGWTSNQKQKDGINMMVLGAKKYLRSLINDAEDEISLATKKLHLLINIKV